MKGNNSYTPAIGERVLISPPNADNDNGYLYTEFDVLWVNEVFILFGNKDCWPNLEKLEHVHIKSLG